MLKIQEIRELIKLIDQSSIDEFVFEHEGSKVQMKKNQETTQVVQKVVEQATQAATVVAQPQQVIAQSVQKEIPSTEAIQPSGATETAENLHKITSPMVGTFYASPSPDAAKYVSVGDKVNADTVVCIVEAMKLFNEIEAEVSGEIVEVLAENGQLVEYGQPLFLVRV